MAVALALGALAPAQAAPRFYEGATMAYASAVERRDGGVVLAFLRENDEVNGYYCQCNGISDKRMNLDKYGKASIAAVFQLDLDSEGETTLVLSRNGSAYGLHAYRYERSGGRMFKVAALQPALDAIVRGARVMDEARVRAALASLQLIDYSIDYAPTGVAQFDAIEHAHGTLVGYFNIDGKLLPGKPADTPAFAYKKTYQEKDGHFLTVTYLLGKGWEGGRAPSYHVKWITWETQPQRFAATQDGLFIEYDVNCCVGSVFARGQYAQGKRTGQWHYEEPNTIRSSGAFVDDKAEGPWTYESGDDTTTGMMHRGQRTGRWEVRPGVDEWREADMHSYTGYDTFVKDRLDGPSERRVEGVVQWQGNYMNGKKQGQWVEPGGGGLYIDDVKQGPWKKATPDGGWQVLTMLNGKPDGKLEQFAASGQLELVEHYRFGVLDGTMESFYPDGKRRYQGTFADGKHDGAETLLYPDGELPQFHRNWHKGVLHGVSIENFRNGKPKQIGSYDMGKKTGRYQYFRDDGQLIEETVH
jgi:antitoxin component YwqK of YwqJK toxin-antitoxin module